MSTKGSVRAAGRPRDPAIDRAILEATLAVLREHGYRGFSLEAVATLAGTTKPTIARRWSRRQELVIAALVTVLVTPPVPDTGCTRCDLIVCVELLADALLHRVPGNTLAPLVAECATDPELHRHLIETLVQPVRDAVTDTVTRAVERGHLRPGLNVEHVVDLLASLVFQASLFGESRFTACEASDFVDMLLNGIAVDFEELVAISKAMPRKHRHRY